MHFEPDLGGAVLGNRMRVEIHQDTVPALHLWQDNTHVSIGPRDHIAVPVKTQRIVINDCRFLIMRNIGPARPQLLCLILIPGSVRIILRLRNKLIFHIPGVVHILK